MKGLCGITNMVLQTFFLHTKIRGQIEVRLDNEAGNRFEVKKKECLSINHPLDCTIMISTKMRMAYQL